jgi:hypothetical protein
MGKNKLRVRRLTLAPRISTKDDEEDGDTDGDLVLAVEHLHRVVEVAVASSSTRPKPVHGVEDRIGRRFWARDSDSDSDVNEVDHLATSLSKLAINPTSEPDTSRESASSSETAAVSTSPEIKPEKEASSKRSGNEAEAKLKVQPWRGPLPPPRTSPRRTFGDALASTQVCLKPRSRKGSLSTPKAY